MKIKVFKDKAGEYRWTLIAANGKKVATSGEGYTRKRIAIRAARAFLKKAPILVV